jgi:hypothetical protein
MNDSSLILHLFYEEPSIYLLDKVSKFYKNDTLYLSLVKDSISNQNIINYAKNYYNNIIINEEENRGNDQYGLYKIFTKYEDDLNDWVFYFHDKHISKLNWIDDLINPFCSFDPGYLSNKIGIVVSDKPTYQLKILNESELIKQSDDLPKHNKIVNIRSKQTLVWVRELQQILFQDTGLMEDDHLNFDFTAGNMFCIKKSILKLALNCIHDNFFEMGYRKDGEVGHGLERFYFYVNLCLKYNVLKIGAC